jgi:phage terminase small subunit
MNRKGAKQERFIQEYLVDLNAKQAAIRAGYSKKTAKVQGAQLLSKLDHKIQPLLLQVQQENAINCGVSRDRWLLEVKRCAFVDPRRMFDSLGNPIEIKELDDDSAAAIAGFEFEESFIGKKGEDRVACGVTKKFKLVNKQQALELFGKATGYYTDEPPRPPSPIETATVKTLLRMQALAEEQLSQMRPPKLIGANGESNGSGRR